MCQITLFGLSAGSASVALLLEKFSQHTPFHSVILDSGVNDALDSLESSDVNATLATWDMLAEGLNCSSVEGIHQLECLRKLPAETIEK